MKNSTQDHGESYAEADSFVTVSANEAACGRSNSRDSSEGELEAPPGIEPGMEVLQTSALPLGDGAL